MGWKDIIGTIAPVIGTALGGPVGGLAVKAISNALLGTPDATQEEVEAAVLGASPETLLKVKTADHKFKLDMKALGVDLARIDSADRSNARDKEIKTGDKTPQILAIVIVSGFFLTLWFVATQPIQEQAIQPINILLGALTAGLIQVLNYFYGSSSGSAKKNDIIAKGGR